MDFGIKKGFSEFFFWKAVWLEAGLKIKAYIEWIYKTLKHKKITNSSGNIKILMFYLWNVSVHISRSGLKWSLCEWNQPGLIRKSPWISSKAKFKSELHFLLRAVGLFRCKTFPVELAACSSLCGFLLWAASWKSCDRSLAEHQAVFSSASLCQVRACNESWERQKAENDMEAHGDRQFYLSTD